MFKGMIGVVRWVCALAAACLALGAAGRCRAGDEIEHRHMIYALAIATGYSPAEARVISDASWSVDQNNSTLATPGGIGETVKNGALFAARVATDPEYARRLLTSDTALDEEIFSPYSNALMSRIGPSAFEHSLMQDPRARDDKNAPGLDLVYKKYAADQMKKAAAQGAKPEEARQLRLVLMGQYLHQVVDSQVHPKEALLGHGLSGHGPDLAVHNEPGFTQAAFKVMTALRVTLPEIRGGDEGRMKSLGLETTEKQLAFCGDLVHAIASSYGTTRKMSPGGLDFRDPTPEETVQAGAEIRSFMGKLFRDRGLADEVNIPPFHRVAYDLTRGNGMEIRYEGKRLATVDNVVSWVRTRPEYKDLVDSVRVNVRSAVGKIRDSVGGVRMDYDQQALLQILTGGDASASAKRLAELDARLRQTSDPAESRKIVGAFCDETKTKFLAGRKSRALDGLTAVSLKEVVGAAEKYAGRWGELPSELRAPGWLTRIHGYILTGDDIILLGRREAGVSPLELDDLVVGLRAVWKENTVPQVSLDPDGADLRGDPRVRILGVPEDSGFALGMLDADYSMKRIMLGADKIGVAGYRSLQDTLGPTTRPFVSRFWLYPIQPRVGDIEVAPDATSALYCGGVQVLSEEMLQIKGGLVGTGETFGPAAEAAASFSAHLDAIEAQRPAFRRLHGLFDIVLTGRLLRVAGVESPILDRLCALPHRAVHIPATYRAVSVKSTLPGGERELFGGVDAKVGGGRRSWMAGRGEELRSLRARCEGAVGGGKLAAEVGGPAPMATIPALRADEPALELTRAVAGLVSGDLDAALKAADRLVAADRWDGEALLVRAVVQMRRVDYAAARRDAERARDLDPDDREVGGGAAEILFGCAWMEGRPEEALRAIEAGPGADVNSAAGQLRRGDALASLDRIDEARKAYQRAIDLDPVSALACARMAELELSHGKGVLSAKPWVERARLRGREAPEVRLVEAMWEQSAEIRPDLAEEIATELWEKKSNSPEVRLRALAILAAVSASREKWDDVDRRIGMMSELSAGAPEVLVAAAEIAITWGEKKRAAGYLARAEKLSAKHPLVIKLGERLKK